LLFLCAYILGLRANERPNFVALQTTHLETAHSAIVISGTGATDLSKQLGNCVLRRSGHADSGANRAAFDEAINHSGAGFGIKAIHIDSYTIAALACQEESA
jgi:hypothetical protein